MRAALAPTPDGSTTSNREPPPLPSTPPPEPSGNCQHREDAIPSPEFLTKFDAALEILNEGDFGHALEQFLELDATMQPDADVKYNIAVCYVERGQIDEAKRFIEKALALKPEYLSDALEDTDLSPLHDFLPQTDIPSATNAADASVQSPRARPSRSILSPIRLVHLFVLPRRYFQDFRSTMGIAPFFLMTWLYGVAYSIRHIDRKMVHAEFGPPRGEFIQFLTESWIPFWPVVLGLGIVFGWLLWSIGGWWYRVRIQWSGAVNPDRTLARMVFASSSMVFSVPLILVALLHTFLYPNYMEMFYAGDKYLLLFSIFPFWSL